MTMGQRIAQKRKELGLSQEALGEKLGVSRQAIYKWESDAALPEIEKLVALSRLFSVTVGELLGVEEPEAPESGESTRVRGDLVEEILRRYRESEPQPPKKRRWPSVAAAAAILILAVSLVSLNGRMHRLRQDYHMLQSSVGQIDRQVDSRISSITAQVEQVINRVSSFTTDQSAEIRSVDCPGGTVTLDLRASPKTYTQGMTARFQAVCGEEILEAEGVLGENLDFSGTLTMPLTDETVEVSVVFTTGDKQEVQPIRSFFYLLTQSFPAVELYHNPPLFFHMNGDLLEESSYDVAYGESDYDELPRSRLDPEKTRLGLFADGNLVQWLPEAGENTYLLPKPVVLDRSKTYGMALVLVDEYGREHVFADHVIGYDESNGWDYHTVDGMVQTPEIWNY